VLIRSQRDLEQAFVGMQFIANALLGEVAAMKGADPVIIIDALRAEVLRPDQY